MDEIKARGSHTLRIIGLWIATIASILIVGIASYGVYQIRQYIPIVGYFWLVSAALLPTIAVIFLGTWLAKYIMQETTTEIGQFGTRTRWFNQVTEYHPLGIKEYRSRITQEKEKHQIPALLDLLKSGLIGNGDLLLGYHREGDKITQRWGSWDDLRTFVVAGKSRSGKTVTMTFFIVQALLEGAVVCVCDPHATKPTGLLKALKPILPFLKTARTHEQIYNLTLEYKSEMEARKADENRPLVPWLIVYDEWSELLRDMIPEQKNAVVDMVLGCGEAYAGYNGFCMVGGQEWTANESGGKKGGAVRRAFHAYLVHKIDDEYSKHLMKGTQGKKLATKTPLLPQGYAYFKGANDDEFDYLTFPYYGKEKEALYEVAGMLQPQLSGPETPQELPALNPKMLTSASTSQGQNTKIELENIIALPPLPGFQREVKQETVVTDEQFVSVLREIGKRLKKGEQANDIRKSLGIEGGRAMQEVNAALQFLKEHNIEEKTDL